MARQETLRLPQAVQRAALYFQHRQLVEAEHLCRQILKARPGQFDALHLLGAIKLLHRSNEEGVSLIRTALRANPNSAEALSNLAFGLVQLKRYDEAIASCDRALAIEPNYAEALHNRGIALAKLHRYEEALASYDSALAFKPDDVEVLNDRGVAFEKLDRCHEAITSYTRALAIKPDYVEALFNRGVALAKLNRYQEAITNYDRALALQPDFIEALNNRADVLDKLGRCEEALADYDRALAIKPDFAEALHNRGNTLRGMKQYEEAIISYARVLAIKPNLPYAASALAFCALSICNWNEADRLSKELNDHVVEDKSIIAPFAFLHFGSEPSKQLLCARQYVRRAIGTPSNPLWEGTIYRHDRIKLGYLSGDFHRHATAFLMAQLFELHDRTRFEVVGISFGPDDKSELRSRLAKSFDRFHDVRAKSDQDVAALLNDLEIDIAIDLKGHTTDARPAILAYRPAPIQVSYLGYPGTTGAEFIDYVIADKVVLPFDQQAFYTEKIVHLPECYQVNDSKRPISPQVPTRSEVGLPEEGLVFCCFNNSRKITAPVFEVWMRLLRSIEGSVLWLLRSNDAAAGNLRREAEARGVDPSRLVFAGELSLEDHLGRHRLADLFLDTLPVNAHTTASDALWAGLPVVTCMGTTFAGRVAASLLYAVGLPELVTGSLEDYEALAMKLASESALLGSLRRKLETNRLSCPLFDTDRFRRHIEAAYTTMWELWQRGESPRSFSVDPSQMAND